MKYANHHPFYVSIIHNFKSHCLENSAPIFGKCLVRYSLTLLYIISNLCLYPNGYGVVFICRFKVLLILFV